MFSIIAKVGCKSKRNMEVSTSNSQGMPIIMKSFIRSVNLKRKMCLLIYLLVPLKPQSPAFIDKNYTNISSSLSSVNVINTSGNLAHQIHNREQSPVPFFIHEKPPLPITRAVIVFHVCYRIFYLNTVHAGSYEEDYITDF